MNYRNLKSLIGAKKAVFSLKAESESFRVAPRRERQYIEPGFRKVVFETERPAVILISAVGATGKTALAQILSRETQLPLLDLGKHKPVGDNTLTGLLTNAFRVEDLSSVFEAIGNGSYGVIIDGVDEGRSKTTEKAFEAFLDDIVRLCARTANTSCVLLGRTQILDDCWVYLTDAGTTTGLITILPFGLDRARQYVDTFTGGNTSSHAAPYREVRDGVLSMLGAAFADQAADPGENFLSFIGYPPVLDAIVTLLSGDPNYYRIQTELRGRDADNVEIGLLYRIGSYILRREKEQKVIPNIVDPLVIGMPERDKKAIAGQVYEAEEQCMRLVSHCLGKQLTLNRIGERLINERYEAQLLSWLQEHPFINGRQFRNAVFESLALATLIASSDPLGPQLVLEYVASHKYNYYLVYFLDRLAPSQNVPIGCLQVLLGSALEFRSPTASVEVHVESTEAEDPACGAGGTNVAETEIEVIMGRDMERTNVFTFRSDVSRTASVRLGNRLSSTYMSLPCDVVLSAGQELELTAPVEICASKIDLEAPAMVLKPAGAHSRDKHILLEAATVNSTVASILTNGVDLTIAVSQRGGVTYPCIQYAEEKEQLPPDPALKEKYLRLKRILVHFRRHGRESLAKYRRKVEHERVAGNPVGRAVLRALLRDGILRLSGSHYFLEPAEVDRYLGVSYLDLRKGRGSAKLLQYLWAVE